MFPFTNGEPDQLPIFFEHYIDDDSCDVDNHKVVETNDDANAGNRTPHVEFQQNSDGITSNDESLFDSDEDNNSPAHVSPRLTTSRFGRTVRSPIWMKDFHITDASCAYSIKNFLSYDGLYNEYQSYLTSMSKLVELEIFREAVKDRSWVEATQEEIKSVEENQTWDLVPVPNVKSIIECKLVYKLKYR